MTGSRRRDYEGVRDRVVGHHLLAYLLLGVALVLAGVTIVGALWLGLDAETAVSSFLLTNTAIGLSAAPCGALIARAKPEHPIGWLFLGLGIAPLLTAAMVPVSRYGQLVGWPESVDRLVITIFTFSWPWGAMCCLPLALQLFPTGRPVSRWWRPLAWVTPLGPVLYILGTGPTPELGASTFLIPPGYPIVMAIAGPMTTVILILSVVSLVVRYATGGETVRRQLLWLVWATVVVIAVNVPWSAAAPEGAAILLILFVPLIPISVTIAVLRHGLFDVRLVLSRTVLYLILTAAVIGSYLGLVALLDQVLRGLGAPVMATLIVAIAFNPVRVRLQRVVDRALYGSGRDPVRAVSVVGRQLAANPDGDLTGVLTGLREALLLPYAAIIMADRRVAASGEPPETQHRVPLHYTGETIGELVVGVRPGERRLPQRDRDLLALLAAPLAVALHATALSEELQASRERLVAAGEEERRRLHRELHDSLGPVLTGAALKADAAALQAIENPARAEELDLELSDQLREAISDLRRIVYGLRPPALDELGLVGALRRQEGQLGSVNLTVTAPPQLPKLPAAVEVTAYRVATEAVANVVRHAVASTAVVSLTATPAELTVSVVDNGRSVGGWSPGVGLRSISERVAEVGGSYSAGPTTDGGRVVACLPLRDES